MLRAWRAAMKGIFEGNLSQIREMDMGLSRVEFNQLKNPCPTSLSTYSSEHSSLALTLPLALFLDDQNVRQRFLSTAKF